MSDIKRITQGLGIVTDPSALEAGMAPKGAMRQADNVLLHRSGAIQPRPGFGDTTGLSTPRAVTWRPIRIWPYGGDLVIQSKKTEGSLYRLDLGSAATTIVDDCAPPDATIRPASDAFEARGNFYITTDEGMRKITSAADAVDSRSGVLTDYQQPWTDTTSTTGVRFAIDTEKDVAYRYCWRSEDANGYIRRSEPSSRWVQQNDSATNKLQVHLDRIYLPTGIVAGDVFELYRSVGVTTGSTPPDELYLAVEHTVTSAEVTAGYIDSWSITDDCPEAQLGQTLYTSPSQGGILLANAQPPLANACAGWQGCAWYGNTQEQHTIVTELLHVYDSGNANFDQVGLHFSARTGDFDGSTLISGVSNVDGLKVGQYVSDSTGSHRGPTAAGTNIAASTKITAIATVLSISSPSDGQTMTFCGGLFTATWKTAVTDPTTQVEIGVSDSASATKLALFIHGKNLTREAGTPFLITAVDEYPSAGDVTLAEYYGHGVELSVSGGGSVVYGVTMSAAALGSASGAAWFAHDYITVNGVEFYTDLFGGIIAPGDDPNGSWTLRGDRLFPFTETGSSPTDNAELTAVGVAFGVNCYALTQSASFGVRVYRDYEQEQGVGNGVLIFRRTTPDLSSFSVQCAIRPEAFRPQLGTAYSGDSARKRNRLMWSKVQEPEAVPPLYSTDIGRRDADILAIVPLRDALLVFKEDGLWRVTGAPPDAWRVDEVDLSIRLLNPQAVAVLDNVCYAWTDRGVLAITEAGVNNNASQAIAHTFREIQRSYPADATPAQCVWMEAHPRLGVVLLGTNAASPTSDVTSHVYVLHRSGAWSRWPIVWRCAAYDDTEDRLVIGHYESDAKWGVYYERSDEDAAASYRDLLADNVVPSSWTSTTVVVLTKTDIPWTPTTCDVLEHRLGTFHSITAVADTGSTWTLTVTPAVGATSDCDYFLTDEGGDYVVDESGDRIILSSGTCDVDLHQAFTSEMTWQTQHLPGRGNRWQEIHAQLLDGASAYVDWTLTLGGATENDETPLEVDATVSADVARSRPVRVGVPRDMVRAAHVYPYAKVCEAGVLWRLGELEYHHTPEGRRVRR